MSKTKEAHVKYVIKRENNEWNKGHIYLILKDHSLKYTRDVATATLFTSQHDALVQVATVGMDADGTFRGDRISIAKVRAVYQPTYEEID